jgi:hypothetical protein
MDETQNRELLIEVSDAAEGDGARLEQHVLELKEDLKETGVDHIEPCKGEAAPAHSKSPELIAGAAAFVVTVGTKVLPKMVDVLQQWVKARGERRITVRAGTITVDVHGGITAEELSRIVASLKRAQGHRSKE